MDGCCAFTCADRWSSSPPATRDHPRSELPAQTQSRPWGLEGGSSEFPPHSTHLFRVLSDWLLLTRDPYGPQYNIMINAQGTPLLVDFGLSSIAEDIYSASGFNAASGGSVRWSAPELVGTTRSRQGTPTTQSDIYSLGMVVVEVNFRFPFFMSHL